MDYIIGNKMMFKNIDNKETKEKIKILIEHIKKENEEIEKNGLRRCIDCDNVVDDKRDFIKRCLKCYCIHQKYTSKEQFKFITDDD